MTVNWRPTLTALAAATLIALAGCTPNATEPAPTTAPSTTAPSTGAPSAGEATSGPTTSSLETCELATGAVQITVPAGFVREESSCVWDNGDAHLSLTAVVDDDTYDIADHLAEARSYEGIGGDEDVSELRWQEGRDLFASNRGDLLSYRTAADGDPLRIIVGQSADFQLFYVAPDDGDDGRALFVSIAETIGAR